MWLICVSNCNPASVVDRGSTVATDLYAAARKAGYDLATLPLAERTRLINFGAIVRTEASTDGYSRGLHAHETSFIHPTQKD
jgi:hypothetical protein